MGACRFHFSPYRAGNGNGRPRRPTQTTRTPPAMTPAMTPAPDHPPFRVIVAGSRTFQDYGLLCRTLDRLLCARLPHVVILSGGARGADALGERYAAERGLAVERHPADWRAHGRAAGPVRNGQMVAVAQGLAAFWDGSSRGTRDVIDQARNAGLAIRVVVVQDGG